MLKVSWMQSLPRKRSQSFKALPASTKNFVHTFCSDSKISESYYFCVSVMKWYAKIYINFQPRGFFNEYVQCEIETVLTISTDRSQIQWVYNIYSPYILQRNLNGIYLMCSGKLKSKQVKILWNIPADIVAGHPSFALWLASGFGSPLW